MGATPVPSRVFTFMVGTEAPYKGSVVVGGSVPSGSQIFDDEKEVLASITTFNLDLLMMSI
jgi:hypothetical protein